MKYFIIYGGNLGLVVFCSVFRVLSSIALLNNTVTLFEADQITKHERKKNFYHFEDVSLAFVLE